MKRYWMIQSNITHNSAVENQIWLPLQISLHISEFYATSPAGEVGYPYNLPVTKFQNVFYHVLDISLNEFRYFQGPNCPIFQLNSKMFIAAKS